MLFFWLFSNRSDLSGWSHRWQTRTDNERTTLCNLRSNHSSKKRSTQDRRCAKILRPERISLHSIQRFGQVQCLKSLVFILYKDSTKTNKHGIFRERVWFWIIRWRKREEHAIILCCYDELIRAIGIEILRNLSDTLQSTMTTKRTTRPILTRFDVLHSLSAGKKNRWMTVKNQDGKNFDQLNHSKWARW